jgi:hypothetical protein
MKIFPRLLLTFAAIALAIGALMQVRPLCHLPSMSLRSVHHLFLLAMRRIALSVMPRDEWSTIGLGCVQSS